MKLTAEKIAGLFGVEVGEWLVAHNYGCKNIEFCITEKCEAVNREGFEIDLNWLVTTEITNLPWKPKEGEKFYYPAPHSGMVNLVSFTHCRDDQWRLSHGLCFKTREEAVAKWRELYGVTE